MIQVLTIDIEDWFHCLEPNPLLWGNFERRIEISTDRLLDLLKKRNSSASFFVLGEVAEKHPELISRIAKTGHEIGTHGMYHSIIYKQTAAEFREDLRKSINLLESITQVPVRSYRAPYFSITKNSLWALEILKEEGITIDSSIFPIINHRYGIPNWKRTPHQILPNLWEWPVSTLPTPIGNLPFSGGVYLRFLHWRLAYMGLQILKMRNEPALFYIHPWEIDADQPRIKTKSQFLNMRHYWGLNSTYQKLDKLLMRGNFTTLKSANDELRAAGQL
jgi:polysaccharide deacetylase family protein (PEP-CTERM system associated)